MNSIFWLTGLILLGVVLAQDPQPVLEFAAVPPMFAVNEFASKAMQQRMQLENGEKCDLLFGTKLEVIVNEMEQNMEALSELANKLRNQFKKLMDGQSDKNLCQKDSWCDEGVCKDRLPTNLKQVIKTGRGMQRGRDADAEGSDTKPEAVVNVLDQNPQSLPNPEDVPMYPVHDFASGIMKERMQLVNGEKCDLVFLIKVEAIVNEMEQNREGSSELANKLRNQFRELMDVQSDKKLCQKDSWCDYDGVCKSRGPAKPFIKKERGMQRGQNSVGTEASIITASEGADVIPEGVVKAIEDGNKLDGLDGITDKKSGRNLSQWTVTTIPKSRESSNSNGTEKATITASSNSGSAFISESIFYILLPLPALFY